MDKVYKIIFSCEDGTNGADEKFKGIFEGKNGQMLKLPGDEFHYIHVGLGKSEDVKKEKIKEVCGKIAKELNSLKAKECSIEIGWLVQEFGKKIIIPVIEGIALGGYVFDQYKKDKSEYGFLCGVTIDGADIGEDSAYAEIMADAFNISAGVNIARDLVNTPPAKMTPEIMSQSIKGMFAGTDVEVQVLDEAECEALGMHTFLAVGKSSVNKSKLIVLRYYANKEDDEVLGYVGKGITFDTGGYSLKSNMVNMKTDMAGAAAVCGAIYALAKNKVKTNVVGILPCCENRLTYDSFLPDDVLTTMNGKTIEIGSTDAEGRLILADGITYAIREEGVTKLIDIATLTGSMARTLGGHRAGIFSNCDDFIKRFNKAAKKCGELFWQFPMDDIYRKSIKGDIADLKNSGGPVAGAIFAACFLEEFVEDLPWIHIDIAGAAFKDKPVFDFQAKGATGFGVETLYCLAK